MDTAPRRWRGTAWAGWLVGRGTQGAGREKPGGQPWWEQARPRLTQPGWGSPLSHSLPPTLENLRFRPLTDLDTGPTLTAPKAGWIPPQHLSLLKVYCPPYIHGVPRMLAGRY